MLMNENAEVKYNPDLCMSGVVRMLSKYIQFL